MQATPRNCRRAPPKSTKCSEDSGNIAEVVGRLCFVRTRGSAFHEVIAPSNVRSYIIKSHSPTSLPRYELKKDSNKHLNLNPETYISADEMSPCLQKGNLILLRRWTLSSKLLSTRHGDAY